MDEYFFFFIRFGGGDPGVLKAMVDGGHLGKLYISSNNSNNKNTLTLFYKLK